MKKYKLKSPAKINLTLEIIKKLPNGFHELRSVMLKLENLYDEIEVIIDENKSGIKIICSDKKVPKDKKNICFKAAKKFLEESGKSSGIRIYIKKNIPIGAGLGGGSSNGAAVLLALNDYFRKPLNQKRLIEIAAEVGKDIPFFLEKEKIAYVSGTGETIQPIRHLFRYPILLVYPNVEISTAWAYGELDKILWFMSDKGRKNITCQLISAIKKDKNISGYIYNDFKALAVKTCPETETILNSLKAFGASGTGVTGKGPTAFGIFKDYKDADKAAKIIKKRYPKYFIAIN